MAAPLSPARLSASRRGFNIFNFFNSFSFVFVSGSVITLFAIRLGASNAIVGLLNAVAYSTFFYMPIGKRIIAKKPIVWAFGWAWVGRYTALIPCIFAPALAASGHPGAGIGLLIAGAAGFAIFRGIGLIGNNPVVGYLAAGGGDRPRSDSGEFIVTNTIVNSLAGMVGGLVLAIYLGERATPWSYAIGMVAGIVTGYIGCIYLLQMPEPTDYRPEPASSLLATAREALREPTFNRFILLFTIIAFVSGMGRSFLPVYAKGVFSQADDAVMVYALLANLGAVAMGLLMRLIIDRLGSKPLFIIFTALGLVSFLPMAILPGGKDFGGSATLIALFLAFVHFASAFGFAGEENAAQTYYMALVPKGKYLELSVVYYLAYGIGGSLGSVVGGLSLDALQVLGLGISGSYRVFYGMLCVISAAAIFGMRKLKRLRSASVPQSLGVMFSPRDLRAFDLLARLDRSSNPQEEVKLIHELGKSASLLSQTELLEYLKSPRFEVRMEALLALEAMPRISPKIIQPLILEVEKNTFTTAYVAARVLGKNRCMEAAEALRNALEKTDYLLQGTAAIALARIGDRSAIPLIEETLTSSPFPRVKISAAYALELLDSSASIPVLIASLRKDDPPAFVSDEIILAMANILGIMRDFYPLYSAFLQDADSGLALLSSTAQDIIVDDMTLASWEESVKALFDGENPDGKRLAAFMMRTGEDTGIEFVLAQALLDPGLIYPGMKFLSAAYPLFKHRKSQGRRMERFSGSELAR